jgi:hypothetical protein
MIKMILIFLFLFAVFFFGLKYIKQVDISEKKKLLKIAGYSILCSVLTAMSLIVFVLIF